MSKTAVTVVIDTYNQERYVGAAIESVLEQQYPSSQVEIIVVDDGSTDETAREVARYRDRVIYIRQENQGQAAAINAGVERARGEIVALLDGDDLWYRTKLKQVVEAFERDPRAGLVFHNTTLSLFDGAFRCGMNVGDSPDCLTIVNEPKDLNGVDLLRFAPVATSCSLSFRKALIKKIFPIPTAYRYYADGFLFADSLFFGRVLYIRSCLAEYRAHDITTFCFFGASPNHQGLERMRLVLGLFENHREHLAGRFKDFGLDYTRTEESCREVAARTRAFLDGINASMARAESKRLRLGGGEAALPGYIDFDESLTSHNLENAFQDGAISEILSINTLSERSDMSLLNALTRWKQMLSPGGAIFSVEKRGDIHALGASRIKVAAREAGLKIHSVIPGYSYADPAILTRLGK